MKNTSFIQQGYIFISIVVVANGAKIQLAMLRVSKH